MAASLTIDHRSLPTAEIGSVNPLPPVAGMPEAPYQASTEGLPAEIATNIAYGRVSAIYPYLLQDGYGRERRTAPMRLAVLEDERLRAEFALDLGGRLVRLLDRTTGRDLVYRNAIFQPANLGLRGAWFSGGVEWNIGMRGHWPLTCEPLYAAEVAGPEGRPVLRMWEYERKRGLIVQLDFMLDPEVAALHVQVRVRNPHPRETGMYWWTNIAVAQTAESRVFAPATHAHLTQYDGTLGYVDVTDPDVSRPASAPAAADWFYEVDSETNALRPAPDAAGSTRPWIAALEPDGSGLAHISTSRLKGRKLFVWGDTTGGRRWCDWLGGRNGAYFEIQAGLTTTQYEHIPMPGGATWEWRETLVPLQVDDPRREAEWMTAVPVVDAAVRRTADAAAGAALLDTVKDAAPMQMLHTGAPWGALEAELAARTGAVFDSLPGVRFDRHAGTDAEYWRAVLDGAAADEPSPEAPASYVEGAGWERLLADAPATWLTHYHRGVIAHAAGLLPTATSHYEASLRRHRSAWALRGLGLVRIIEGDADAGIAHLTDALSLAPDSVALVLELGSELLHARRADEASELVASLPAAVRDLGRVRVLAIRAALQAGDRAAAGALLEERFEVPDIREGELSMSELWREAFPERPVPERYDFSMS